MIPFARILIIPALAALAIGGCKKKETIETGPGISKRVAEFAGNACRGGTVTRYDFQGEQVFVFAGNCGYPDEGTYVYDLNGDPVCTLGGIGGFTECRGTRFDGNAMNPEVIYTKP